MALVWWGIAILAIIIFAGPRVQWVATRSIAPFGFWPHGRGNSLYLYGHQ